MSIHAVIEPDVGQQADQRRDMRMAASAEVALRPLGTTAVRARLINLSSLGFMAAFEGELEEGARVWISLPGMRPANARVIWVRGDRLGAEFAEPIDPLQVFHTIGSVQTA